MSNRKCFPNGCCGFCKPPQVQKQIDQVRIIQKVEEKKEIPYGYIRIFPGVRTSESNYTCPMLSVHLYQYSQHQAEVGEDQRTIMIGNRTEPNQKDSRQFKKQEKSTAEETITMIPVEDVIQMTSKAEMKKGIQADVYSELVPSYEFSKNCCDTCCENIFKCCRSCCRKQAKVVPVVTNTTTIVNDDSITRNTSYKEEEVPIPKEKEGFCDRFRCWCCRKRKLTRLIKKTKTFAEQEAQRVITVTIEYSKYSNLNTPTNVQLLSDIDQKIFYKEKFQPNTKLEFYLINSTEFDPNNFEIKRAQAETLCRTAMQLKGMKGHYPSDRELDDILDLNDKRTFGDIYQEPILQLQHNPIVTGKDVRDRELNQPSSTRAIQQSSTTE